jgi:hypothetical protein
MTQGLIKTSDTSIGEKLLFVHSSEWDGILTKLSKILKLPHSP